MKTYKEWMAAMTSGPPIQEHAYVLEGGPGDHRIVFGNFERGSRLIIATLKGFALYKNAENDGSLQFVSEEILSQEN